ncbi:MAG: FkbM family methyltransferase [Terrimonas sp.]|nr:FkbM family methyltransferase [Terrimonas sp.]
MFKENLIYDVGMHNGDDTAYYLSKGYNVISVEADPVQAANGAVRFKQFIDKGTLKILNIGIADKDGDFDFYINEEKPEWNSFDLSITSRDGLPWHAIKIRASKFSSVIQEQGVPYYLKVDIEGHDYLCIDGLDKANLPKYISVEANDITLFEHLAGKGFTKFKLIFQYNLAHLDLPANKYFNRWLWAYRLRQWNSSFIKVFRKLGGRHFIHFLDRRSIPAYSQSFKQGTSGTFGENLGGKWHELDKAKQIYQFYHDLFHNLPNKKDYGFWVDIHATW